ncbi:uncharacterized protein LOC126263509 [Schistocerca nitens]|uniref:uncharacterized protein LOC126263509 n=1 Tax=Schistocerca nitens TaxID=7011 RepID=UPI00211876FA|nr:uncharacterized protein LOC126263509 [Schistocerca nitens]
MRPNSNSSRATEVRNVGQKKAKKVGKVQEYSTSPEEEGEDHNTACIYCNELFSNSKSEEGWVKCYKCSEWAHEQCTGINDDDDDDDEPYKCDFCT